MKWLRGLFIVLGFTFQYIIPLLLFGEVIPYTHGEIAAGLTKMGYLAAAVLAFILANKLKEKLLTLKKGFVRGFLLSLFPIALWILAGVGVDFILSFLAALAKYWWRALIFIAIGRIFYVAEEVLADGHKSC